MLKAIKSEKIANGVKKWHANMSEEKRLAKNRKISKTMQKRHSEMPPRMKKDINIKKSVSFRKFDESAKGMEQRLYLGYLNTLDLLNCSPERQKIITAKQVVGQKKKWDSLTPEQRKLRISKTLGMTRIKERAEAKKCFFEFDVPRKKTYCGVVTSEEMEQMYG